MRALLMTATLVVAGALSAGCGGGDGGSTAAKAEASPSAATTAEFCTAYNSLYDAFRPARADRQAGRRRDQGLGRRAEVDRHADDMPADAQKGLGLVTTTVDKIEPDASRPRSEAVGRHDLGPAGAVAGLRRLRDQDLPDGGAEPTALGAPERVTVRTARRTR